MEVSFSIAMGDSNAVQGCLSADARLRHIESASIGALLGDVEGDAPTGRKHFIDDGRVHIEQ